MTTTDHSSIVPRNVEEEMKESYLRYSMSVIISRALPDVRDGLKPSQRRILYAMRQLNLGPGAKHRKCAKICGDTSGDFHPHGEQVIYPTMVRMAQDWVMRYALVNGQGNFGSIDGDPPAAMRYTEAKMTHAAVQLMDDLDKETVDVIPNYDETKTEPTVFPAKFPNLLCNGSSGIAVGMATNIPPHNLSELIEATLLLLDNPKTSIEELMQVMPGPDFPTGGIICGYKGIQDAYRTGRGKLILRAVVRVEDVDANGDRQRLVVDELPYNVNKARLIEHTAQLVNNKHITTLSDIRDESDKDGMRIVFELKKGVVPDIVLNQLYKYTDLQTTFGCNMLALDKGLPRTMNHRQIIQAWIEHRIDVIRRRTRFELNKAEARAHILEGYLKAIKVLDEVVAIIRASNNREVAKEELISRFDFTDRQANAVLDLRLYQLTGLEHEKIEKEYQDLCEKIDYLRAVLANESMVKDIIREELSEIKAKQVRSERLTKIEMAHDEMHMEDLIANEATVITISQDDYIKRMPTDTFKEQRRGGQGIAGMQMKREEDVVKQLYVATTHNTLMVFTNSGRCYWLKVWQIPETGRRSKGKPLINLLEDFRPDEKIAAVLRIESFEKENTYILFCTKKGTVKKTSLESYSNQRRKGVNAITIDEDDELIQVTLVEDGQQIMLFTRSGMAVRFDQTDVRAIGRIGRGVKGVSLKDEKDCVVGCEIVTDEDTVLIACENAYGKRSYVRDFRQTRRGGVGVRSIIVSDRNGPVVSALSVTDDNSLLFMTSQGQTVRIPVEGLRVMGRATQGVKLINLKEGDTLLTLQKLKNEEESEDKESSDEVDGSVIDESTAPGEVEAGDE
jgi:DNA gyrase subunit A